MPDHMDKILHDRAMQPTQEDLEIEAERLQDKLNQIDNWCKAYPIEQFPEPDFKEVQKVLKANGMTLGSVSASNYRHVLDGIMKIVESEDE